jgi:hypothetical protein
VLLVLLSVVGGHGAAVTLEARSESKSSCTAVRAHSARLPAARTHPDLLPSFALPGTAPEPALPCTFVRAPGAAGRRHAPPRSVALRAEYPRGPPRAA